MLTIRTILTVIACHTFTLYTLCNLGPEFVDRQSQILLFPLDKCQTIARNGFFQGANLTKSDTSHVQMNCCSKTKVTWNDMTRLYSLVGAQPVNCSKNKLVPNSCNFCFQMSNLMQ